MIFVDLNDKRLIFTKEYLTKKGLKVSGFNFNNVNDVKKQDCVVFSPSFKWNTDLINSLPNNITLFTGAIPEDCYCILSKKSINYVNFMKNESFVLQNAKLTAEGVLANLLNFTNCSIYDLNILILGGGRVAKAIGKLFCNLKLNFSFTTKEPKEAKKLKNLSKTIKWENYKNCLKNYDVIINTIPYTLFSNEDKKLFKKNSIVFEIASKKCLEESEFDNFIYKKCPGLPTEFTPKSAGNLIAKYIIKNLKEK